MSREIIWRWGRLTVGAVGSFGGLGWSIRWYRPSLAYGMFLEINTPFRSTLRSMILSFDGTRPAMSFGS